MTHHVHILDDTGSIGVIRLDKHGRAVGDTNAAKHFILHNTHRGHDWNNGEDMLNAIVENLDRATYVSAVHCHDSNHDHHEAKIDEKEDDDEPKSTEPTPVQNPEDLWPEFGGVPEDKVRDLNISNDWD